MIMTAEFQFHKGTIKPATLGNQYPVKLLFQFHKGTIKPSGRYRQLSGWRSFNSIKVRLNLYAKPQRELVQEFQFHKGTIKPPDTRPFFAIAMTFQFHKGTIKPVVCKVLQMVLLCFNSIKVRLNHRSTWKCGRQVLFQFHKGTIKPQRVFENPRTIRVSIP